MATWKIWIGLVCVAAVANMALSASSPVANPVVAATKPLAPTLPSRPDASGPAQANKSMRVLVVAEQESVLAAQMAGRVDSLTVHMGSAIRLGQPLLRFNCDEQDAHLKMAQAEFYGAEQTYESKAKLQAMQSVAELEVQQAAAGAEKAKAQIHLYEAQLRQCSVSAPFSGRVTKLHVKQFESVNIGQPLIEIVNDRRLKLQLNVPSVWLAWLKTGARFSLQIDETGKHYDARVTNINGRVDAVSQSLEIEGEVAGTTTGLLPGMSGQASFAALPKR